MYHYIEDRNFRSEMIRKASPIMQRLCSLLSKEYGIEAAFYLVGSGAKNLITQNENENVDLDYNLEILRCSNIYDGRTIKEAVRKAFNTCLNASGNPDCDDSRVPLTTKPIRVPGFRTRFSIDVCITRRDLIGNYYRLIHEKTGWADLDRYYWNMSPHSDDLPKKVETIKAHDRWPLLRERYLEIKNRYLTRNDHDHPSYVCYVEAVNEIYRLCQPNQGLSFCPLHQRELSAGMRYLR